MRPCPSCAAEPEPGDRFCGQCGARLPPEAPPDPDLRLAATLQGVAEDWSCNGSFDSAEYEGLSFAEALAVIGAMQAPPAEADPVSYCWPNLAFPDGTAISRTPQDGDESFFLSPQEVQGSLADAEALLRRLYAGSG
jgi:hypothetical protein